VGAPAAKAAPENRPLIAAVNRCATQNQEHSTFPQKIRPSETKFVLIHQAELCIDKVDTAGYTLYLLEGACVDEGTDGQVGQ
jgi:hypothetical protein